MLADRDEKFIDARFPRHVIVALFVTSRFASRRQRARNAHASHHHHASAGFLPACTAIREVPATTSADARSFATFTRALADAPLFERVIARRRITPALSAKQEMRYNIKRY